MSIINQKVVIKSKWNYDEENTTKKKIYQYLTMICLGLLKVFPFFTKLYTPAYFMHTTEDYL